MKKTFLLAIAVTILAACLSASPSLKGDWKLISYGDAANPTSTIPDVDTSIKFDSNGRVSGNVGCNSFGGNYEVRGDKIAFSSITYTLMYCEEKSTQEQAVLSILSDNVRVHMQLNGDTLTITSADGSSVVNLARK